MKIIFLDIDGVLVIGNGPDCIDEMNEIDGKRLHQFQKSCVDALNVLTDKTNAKIVLSSCWRIQFKLETLRKQFIHEGVTAEIIGITPSIKTMDGLSVNRGLEIQCWIDYHDHENIESFAILDDDNDMSHLMNKLVLINDFDKDGIESGLTMKHVNDSIDILSRGD